MSSQEEKTLTRTELAARWGVHPGTLANWATWKKGPRFKTVMGRGRKVSYTMRSIISWERTHKEELETLRNTRKRRPMDSGSSDPPQN